MLGVGNDHIGVLDLLHHALCGYLALAAADLLFHLRAAFHVFVFVFDFLLGHAHALHEAVALVRHVNEGNQQQTARKPEHGIGDQLARQGHGRTHIQIAHRHQLGKVTLQHPVQHQGDQTELQNRLDELNQGLGSHHALDAAPGVQLGKFGGDCRQRKMVAAGHTGAQNRKYGGEQQQR